MKIFKKDLYFRSHSKLIPNWFGLGFTAYYSDSQFVKEFTLTFLLSIFSIGLSFGKLKTDVMNKETNSNVESA